MVSCLYMLYCNCLTNACVTFSGAIALYDAQFSEGFSPVSVSSLTCTGEEPILFNCSVNAAENIASCGRFEDAAVICQG